MEKREGGREGGGGDVKRGLLRRSRGRESPTRARPAFVEHVGHAGEREKGRKTRTREIPQEEGSLPERKHGGRNVGSRPTQMKSRRHSL
jgi:hypothetical protein